MPTEEFKALLDRDMSIAGARQLIDLAAPLLRETVIGGASAAFAAIGSKTAAISGSSR